MSPTEPAARDTQPGGPELAWLPLAAVLLFSILALLYLGRVIRIAPEISDVSFYILNTRYPADIDNSTFGLLWNTLFGMLGILQNRVAHLLLLTASLGGAWLFLARRSDRPAPRIAVAAGAGIAALAGLFPLQWGMLDPSYNSLVSIALPPMTVLLVRALEQSVGTSAETNRASLLPCAALGVLFAWLATLKVTAALVLAPLFFGLALLHLAIVQKRGGCAGSLIVARNLGFALMGVVAFLLYLGAFGVSPTDLLDRFRTGQQNIKTLGVHGLDPSVLLQAAQTLAQDTWNTGGRLFPVLSTFCLTATIWILFIGSRHHGAFHRIIVPGGAGAAALYLTAAVWLALAGEPLKVIVAVSVQATAFGLVVITTTWRRQPPVLRLALVVLLLGPYGLSFGSSNPWSFQAALYAGLPITAAALASLALPDRQRTSGLILSAAFLGAGLFAAGLNFETAPYRFGGSIASGTETVVLGDHDETFFASAGLAATHQALTPARAAIRSANTPDARPVLLDLTGRSPGVHLILGLRMPGISWILSGYPGSDDLLDWTLNRLTDTEIAQAWLLVPQPAENNPFWGLNIDRVLHRLDGLGQRFPDDYTAVVEVPVHYMGETATLYRPRE